MPPAGDSRPSPRPPTLPTPRPARPGPPAWWAPRAIPGRQRLPALRRREPLGADYTTAESPSSAQRPATAHGALAVAGDPLTDLDTRDPVRAVYRAGHRVR